MVNLWKKYDSKKTYDEYLNSDHKLRRQAVIISHILERHGIKKLNEIEKNCACTCLLYTSPSPRDRSVSRMPSSA